MTQHPDEGTLHAYIDGELSAGETAALESHVAACAQCASALAEARGLVAAASRTISALDAAPASASPARAPRHARAPIVPLRPARPWILRVPYARAAALLLLAGGTAVVIDRSGTLDAPKTSSVETALSDASTEERAAIQAPAAIAPAPVSAPASAPASATASNAVAATGNDLSERRVAGGGGATTRKATAPAAERSTVATDEASNARAFVDGAQTGAVAQSARAAEVASVPSAPMSAPLMAPPPARMEQSPQEIRLRGASAGAPVTTRLRTKEGVVVTLVEAPLVAGIPQEIAASGRTQLPSRSAAALSAVAVNTYRWSSTELGRSFTLSGPLTTAELEALSRRLAELERVP